MEPLPFFHCWFSAGLRLTSCTQPAKICLSCWKHIPILFLKTPQIVETLVPVQGQISNSFLVLSPADGLYALSFSISSLTLIGMLAVITYTVSGDLRQLFNVASFVYSSFVCKVINASFRRDYFQILLSKKINDTTEMLLNTKWGFSPPDLPRKIIKCGWNFQMFYFMRFFSVPQRVMEWFFRLTNAFGF